MDMYRILENFDAVNSKQTLAEGDVKHALHKKAERMSKADFISSVAGPKAPGMNMSAKEATEFWNNINGEDDEELDEGFLGFGMPKFKVDMDRSAHAGGLLDITGSERDGKKVMAALQKANPELAAQGRHIGGSGRSGYVYYGIAFPSTALAQQAAAALGGVAEGRRTDADWDDAAIQSGKRGRDARDNPSRHAARAKAGQAMRGNAKPDFLDLDRDGDKTEPMKSAAKGVAEGDMETVREVFPGTPEYELRFGKDDAASAFDKKKISTGTVYSRKHFDEPDTDDDAPRAAGRPKGTGRKLGAKGPSVASKLLKGKGGLKEYEMEHDHMNGLDRDEYDQEGQMARQDLHTMVDAARELHAILGSDENLPEWVQSKITKALDYIDTARDYMQSVDAERGDQPVAEIAPVIGAMAGRALAGAAGAGSVGQALGGLAGRAVAGAMNSGNDDVAEASPPGGFKAGDKVTVDGQKGPTGSTTGVFVQQLPTRNDQQPAYAFRFDDKKYPGNTYDTVAGNQIFPAGVSEATGDAGFDSMMGTMQVNVELSKNVMEEFLTIYYGALDGEDMTDNISDELGDHFSQVRRSKDPVLKKCYKAVRELADDEIDAQLKGTLRAIRMMLGDPAYTPPPKPPMSASDQVWVDRLVNAMTAALASHGIKAHPNWLNKEPGNNKEPGVSEAGYSAKAGRAGKDLGKPGKNFSKIAAGAAERYGSKAAGERVAGAVLNKLRAKEGIDEQGTDEGYFSDLDVQRKDKQLKGTQAYHAKKKSEKEQRSADSKQSFNNMFGGSPAELTSKLKIRDVEEDQLGELSPKTLGSYVKKAKVDMVKGGIEATLAGLADDDDEVEKSKKLLKRRAQGTNKAVDRLSKEAVEEADKKDLPFTPDTKSSFKKSTNPNRTNTDTVKALAQKGLADMTTAELKAELKRRDKAEESTDVKDQHAEKAGKKVTQDIESDDKKGKKEVEETTVSGSVAPAAGGAAPKSKGGMQFGKGVYEGQVAESFESKLHNILNEGMSVNVSTDDTGKKSISVNATDADADALGDMLKMAGLFSSEGYSSVCQGCGGIHKAGDCGADMVEEELANSPDEVYTDADYMTQTLSGGLNGPKRDQTTNGIVKLDHVAEQIKETANTRLWNLYKQYEKK